MPGDRNGGSNGWWLRDARTTYILIQLKHWLRITYYRDSWLVIGWHDWTQGSCLVLSLHRCKSRKSFHCRSNWKRSNNRYTEWRSWHRSATRSAFRRAIRSDNLTEWHCWHWCGIRSDRLNEWWYWPRFAIIRKCWSRWSISHQAETLFQPVGEL